MNCMQLNALVTDYLLSNVSAEINDIIREDEEMRENAHLIWKFLKNLYDKDCSVLSVINTAYQKPVTQLQKLQQTRKFRI